METKSVICFMISNKKDKIINDPIYGFITIKAGIITELIDHPTFKDLEEYHN